MLPHYSPDNLPQRLQQESHEWTTQLQRLLDCGNAHAQRITSQHSERLLALWQQALEFQRAIAQAAASGEAGARAGEYATDAAQRLTLTLDTLRERARNDRLHAEAGTPPVLDYDYEVVIEGRDLARPVNYQLLRILPPEGCATGDSRRPFMIIDPRAGHGPGIGGFKPDSQVGVALKAGHPVYFVVFRQHAEPGQELADVMRAEAGFLREIARRHPDAPKPVVVGNCQGGWATLVLAAANPEITGPLVINGSPVATWSGQVGANPMRYNGGLLGGIAPALLSSDLGHGEFDGAHLVSNFELLNPGRNYFGKYFDLYRDVDESRESFLDFERWWGGYMFLNEAEIRWIVDQLFVGNKLARNQAELEPGRHLDLKFIRSPIIVFASRGDNITPPQQALNWIVDTWADEHEIRVRGQRIVYMVHDKVGHLGIFVSSSIARKEHAEMTSTLKTIEALAPGLYEMKIEQTSGSGVDERFVVSFHERRIADILEVVPNDRELERGFGAVARLSQIGADVYEATLRPWVQASVTPQTAQALRELHPSRVSRRVFSDENPLLAMVAASAGQVREQRQRAAPDNPFIGLERLWAAGITQGLDLWRDLRDAGYEAAFLSIYGTPWMGAFGQSRAVERTRKDPAELRNLPVVQAMLLGIETGGYEAALIRMLILLAESRGSVRRDRLERSAQVLTTEPPFAALSAEQRARLIHEQSIIVEFEPERALLGLPRLLKTPELRQAAIERVHFVVGALDEMEPHSRQMLGSIERVLGVGGAQQPAEAAETVTEAVTQEAAAAEVAAASAPATRTARRGRS